MWRTGRRTAEGFEQQRGECVHRADWWAMWLESVAEPFLEQTIENRSAPSEDVNGHAPRHTATADRRRRLMIAERDDDHVVARMLTEIARDGRVLVCHRMRVAWPQVSEIGRRGHRSSDVAFGERIRGEHARPIRLIRRNRP